MENFEKFTLRCDEYFNNELVETNAKVIILDSDTTDISDVFDTIVDFLSACGYAKTFIAKVAKEYAEEYGNRNM